MTQNQTAMTLSPIDQTLLDAVRSGDLALLRQSLANGANPNLRLPDQDTLLLLAARRTDGDSLRALIDAGADVQARDSEGHDALWWAATRNAPESCRGLLAAGCDTGTTALFVATALGRDAVVWALLDAGVSPQVRDAQGRVPLHFAAAGHPACLAALLCAGAEVDAVDRDGVTPLMQAMSHADAQSARLLLATGADPQARDRQGRDVADWARGEPVRDLLPASRSRARVCG